MIDTSCNLGFHSLTGGKSHSVYNLPEEKVAPSIYAVIINHASESMNM